MHSNFILKRKNRRRSRNDCHATAGATRTPTGNTVYQGTTTKR